MLDVLPVNSLEALFCGVSQTFWGRLFSIPWQAWCLLESACLSTSAKQYEYSFFAVQSPHSGLWNPAVLSSGRRSFSGVVTNLTPSYSEPGSLQVSRLTLAHPWRQVLLIPAAIAFWASPFSDTEQTVSCFFSLCHTGKFSLDLRLQALTVELSGVFPPHLSRSSTSCPESEY